MTNYAPGVRLDWDWYDGRIPANVQIDESAYVETTFSFTRFASSVPSAVSIGRGAATYLGTMFDIGPLARVRIGDYAFVHGVWFICDSSIEVGENSMLSWNVVLMDTYRASPVATVRREQLRGASRQPDRRLQGAEPARPVRIGRNVWIGFDVVVMPGVTIGDGSIVGAKSVVFDDLPAYTIAAGNPARVIRDLPSDERLTGR